MIKSITVISQSSFEISTNLVSLFWVALESFRIGNLEFSIRVTALIVSLKLPTEWITLKM